MLNITNGRLLSVTHSKEYLGEAFNYRDVKNISVIGTLLSNTDDGIEQTWNQVSSYIPADWSEIKIDNYSLGSGKISSIALPEGADVFSKEYNINISFFEDSDLSNFTGAYYSMPSLPTGYLKHVSNFSESFDFTSNSEQNYEYSRSVSFGIVDNVTGDPIPMAKSLASGFFLNDPSVALLTSQYPNFYQESGKRTYAESYDLDSFQFQFSENFSFNNDNPYIWNYTQAISNSNGRSSVTENGTVLGVNSQPYLEASGAFDTIQTGAYSRANAFYSSYNNYLNSGSSCALPSGLVSSSKVIDRCAGSIGYSFSYSNDPSFSETGLSHNYTLSLSQSQGFYQVSENGSIKALGSQTGDFNRALNKYNTVESGIFTRVENFANSALSLPVSSGLLCQNSGSFYKTNKTESYSEFNTKIDYGQTFSNNPSYLTDDPYFVKFSISSGDAAPTHIANLFDIPNFKEVSQPSNQSSLGIIDFECRAVGKPNTSLQKYIDKSFSGMNTGSLGYLQDLSYTFNPESYNFQLSASFVYSRYREYEDFLVW